MRFGSLVVKKEASTIIDNSGCKRRRWYCDCDCGTEDYIVMEHCLVSNNTKSCGCARKKTLKEIGEKKRKYNKYDLSGEYGIGWTTNSNEEFYFDLEDYDKIKDYRWLTDKDGYIVSHNGKKMHRMVMNVRNNQLVDHIGHNHSDNRKHMLRIATKTQNNINQKKYKNNTSGVPGVNWKSSRNTWCVRIGVNNQRIHVGYFKNFDDAVKARKEAEEKYFGEFSYDNSIKQAEQYAIN